MDPLRTIFSPIHTGVDSQQSALAAMLLDPTWGLIRATRMPDTHELCLALGEHYAAVARGTGSSKGLINLIPVLIEEAAQELKDRHAPVQEARVLLAIRLIWACPKLGARGMRVARKAWVRAWGRGAGAEKHFPVMD